MNKLNTVLSLLIIIVLSNCASFSGDKLSDVEIKVVNPEKKSLYVELSANANAYGLVNHESTYGKKLTRDILKDTLEQTKLFSKYSIREDAVDKHRGEDLIHNAVIHYENDSNFWLNYTWAMVSGSTLMIIPYWESMTIKMKASISDKTGKELGIYEFSEDITTVAQALMIFVAPFAWPQTVEKEITKKMIRNLIKAAQKDNII